MNLQYGQYPYNAASIPQGYCNAPSEYKATLNGDIVTLSWINTHAVLYYTLTIKLKSDNSVVWTGNIRGTRYIKQLQPATAYVAELVTICSDDPERKAETVLSVDFTTGAHVVQPLPVNITDVLYTKDTDSVLIAWPPSEGAIIYKVYYRPKGSTLPYDVLTTDKPNARIDFLIPNTEYEFYIEAVTSNGQTVRSETGSFNTPIDVATCPPPQISVIVNETSAVVAWKHDMLAEAYDVYLNGALYISNYSSNLINLIDLDALTEYTVSVVSRCGSGTSVAGNKLFITGGIPNTTPSDVTHEVGDTDIVFTWPPVPGATSYNVVINGTLYTTTAPSITIPFVSGATYNADVSAVSTAGESLPIRYTVTAPIRCFGVTASTITTIATATSISLNWPDITGIELYEWRYKETAQSDQASTWVFVSTANSELEVNNLKPNTSYDFEIQITCIGTGSKVTTAKQVTTAATNPNVKPVVTAATDITHNSLCAVFTTTAIRSAYSFVVKLITKETGILKATVPTTEFKACFSNLEADTEYTIVVEDHTVGYDTAISDEFDTATCYECDIVTGLKAVYNEEGDIFLSWTKVVNATGYKVYTRNSSDGVWELIASVVSETSTVITSPGNSLVVSSTDNYLLINDSFYLQINDQSAETSTYPHLIDNAKYAYKEIKVETVYSKCATGTCTTTITTGCAKAQGLTADVEGNHVTLNWNDVPDIYNYRIVLTTLLTGTSDEFSEVPYIVLTDLAPNTTYSAYVEILCTGTIKGAPSDSIVFTTGDILETDTGCGTITFTAVYQTSPTIEG